MSCGANGISMDDTMQSSAALGPGSLISESARILELVFQDPFYAVYSAESTITGAKAGITEYYPADLVARAPSGDVLLRSLELQDLFNLGRDRFMAEAKALASLSHPNLLHFDGIVSDHGTACALHAPEEGQSITNLIKSSSQPPSQEEIDAALKELAPALELLHSRGLIHANITPDTILLRPDPLLVRFGATRSFLAARMRKVNLAVTPGYSAPELHFSDEKAHGPLCDVYSLAAVLYYVVTGRHPVNVIARGLGHTMPPAAALPSQRFRPQFLEAIDRGLELEPGRRPQNIKAFGEMLLRIPEKKAPESAQPAFQLSATRAEGAKVQAPSSQTPPNGKFSRAAGAVPNSPAHTPREPGDGNGEIDETPDFGSNWRGLGIGRLLVLALVLALIISAGLWMLEAQFKKQEQAARLDPGNAAIERVGSDRPASQEQRLPAGSKERSPAASPSEQTPVPPSPAEPENRTAAVITPGPEMRPAEAPAKLPPATVKIARPMKETEKPRAKEAEANPPHEIKHPLEAAPPSPAFAVATAICGLEARAGEGQQKTEVADQAVILKGAGQAFERRFAEGFIQQSCLVRDLHQKEEQLGEKIKEAEEKRDKARVQLEARVEAPRVEAPPSQVSGQKQGNEDRPETKSASESERERLKATVQEQQSLMLTLSAERQRIEAEKIAAEQTLNERLKEQKLAHDLEPPPEKSASGNTIDEPSAQLPANAVPLANAKKSVALKCSDILMRLQLGESDQSDLDALRQCALRQK
jgi:serine/threonine protein kinase